MAYRDRIRLALMACAIAWSASGCTQSERMTFACEHCACDPAQRDATHPIRCDLLPLDQWLHCCVADGS